MLARADPVCVLELVRDDADLTNTHRRLFSSAVRRWRVVRQSESARIKLRMAAGDFTTPFVASIDEGTQSCRFMVFDKKGKLVAVHQQEKQQIYPQPGWCEHDPNEIIANVNTCIDKVCTRLKDMGYSAGDIKGVGITNQRETTVVWDRQTGEPLHNAVVWLDTRTASTVEELTKKFGGDANVFSSKCGLPISTYFSAVKLVWLLQNKPEIRAKAEAGEALFGTIDTWLLYKLGGGVHVTDVTNAARTMLMNLKTLQWDAELCDAFGIPMSMLPQIKSSAEVYAEIQTGLAKGVSLAACLGDQQSAMVGHAAFNKGDSKNTYGTGCFMLLNTGETPVLSKAGLLTTVCYQLGPKKPVVYALEGSVAIAGVGMSWLKDNLNIISDVKESSALAASVEDTGGVYLVPAFSGLFAPYWDQTARGVIVGLTQYTTRAHIVRAMIEAVAYQTMDVASAMVKDSGVAFSSMKVDGGMTANEVLVQFQADMLQCPVLRPSMPEITVSFPPAARVGSLRQRIEKPAQ